MKTSLCSFFACWAASDGVPTNSTLVPYLPQVASALSGGLTAVACLPALYLPGTRAAAARSGGVTRNCVVGDDATSRPAVPLHPPAVAGRPIFREPQLDPLPDSQIDRPAGRFLADHSHGPSTD